MLDRGSWVTGLGLKVGPRGGHKLGAGFPPTPPVVFTITVLEEGVKLPPPLVPGTWLAALTLPDGPLFVSPERIFGALAREGPSAALASTRRRTEELSN